MKNPRTLRSEIKIKSVLISLFGGFGALILSYFLVRKSLDTDYPQILGLLFGGFFGLIGLISVMYFFTFNVFELDKEKLIVRSIFKTPKKTIYLRDIISYTDSDQENESSNNAQFTIYTIKEQYVISNYSNTNYLRFKRILTKDKFRIESQKKLNPYKVNRLFSLALILIGLAFLFGLWHLHKKGGQEILPSEIVSLKVTISNKVEIRRSRNSRSIRIETKEYPNFGFDLSGNSFKATNTDRLITNVRKGDVIEMKILKDVYEKKLAKTKPLSFWNKSINYYSISVFGLKDNNQTYLTLRALNNERKGDTSSLPFYFFLLISIGITISGVYTLFANKKPMNTMNIKSN